MRETRREAWSKQKGEAVGLGKQERVRGKEEEVGKNAGKPSALREGLVTSLAFHFPAFPCQPPPPPQVRTQDRATLRPGA